MDKYVGTTASYIVHNISPSALRGTRVNIAFRGTFYPSFSVFVVNVRAFFFRLLLALTTCFGFSFKRTGIYAHFLLPKLSASEDMLRSLLSDAHICQVLPEASGEYDIDHEVDTGIKDR